MSSKYNQYFGFKREPFMNNLPTKNLLKLPDMIGVKERMDYVLNIGGVVIVTGEVGSGKSTALRWSSSHYHPSEVLILNITANSGSIIELYKQLCWELSIEVKTSSRSALTKIFKETVKDIVISKKQKVMVIIDEANLLRADIFAEIHVLTQFENDSKNMISIVFAGQANLLDKFIYRLSAPLASRVIGKIHLTSINREQMFEYLLHHLKIAGVNKMIFSDAAISAIQQGSGGILRKANALSKGGLIACSIDGEETVSAEHIRIASTELI